jgi:hypothetical protein
MVGSQKRMVVEMMMELIEKMMDQFVVQAEKMGYEEGKPKIQEIHDTSFLSIEGVF